MKTIHTLCLLVAATMLFGCRTTPPHNRTFALPVSEVTLVVSCSEPSMDFTGTIVCDGRTNRVSGTGGGTFHATGHDIVASFRKSGAGGRISLQASEAGGGQGSSSTAKEFGGVRAEFHREPLVSQVFTTF